MSLDITISIDQNIHDPLIMGQTDIVGEIFRIAADVIRNGGRVIVKRVYTNADPDRIFEFSTEEELKGWKKLLNEAQIVLGRDEIQ